MNWKQQYSNTIQAHGAKYQWNKLQELTQEMSKKTLFKILYY